VSDSALQYLFPALIAFVFVMFAAYTGALRALDVYFDPYQDSVVLSDDSESPSSR